MAKMAFETFLVVIAAFSCATWLAVFRLSPVVFTWLSSSYGGISKDKRHVVDDSFKAVVYGCFAGPLAWYAYICTEIPPEGVWLDVPLVRFLSALYMGSILAQLIVTIGYPYASRADFILYKMHHAVSLYSTYIGASYPAMPYYANVCYMMQLSNPSVYLRVILKELGYKDSKFYMWNFVVMGVTFAVCRVLVTSIATFNLVKVMVFQDAFSRLPLHVSLCYIMGALVFNGLNYYWFSLMCKRAIDRVFGKEKEQQL
ncbi:TLC domain-containing protein 4-B-like [Branchiostoma lanceolatum]|uniref:TLC domain-containing protein 4-B-like n=1 Tax=Branchiostoma lanceolatum TaxID=7740 RepID=UPI003456E551